MTGFISFLIVIALGLIDCALSTLDITLHNVDVILQDRFNESLTIEYSFEESIISTQFITESNVCVLIDGRECQCFDGVNSVVWPIHCKPTENRYWFSILFKSRSLDDSRSIASLPIRIHMNDKVPINQLTLVLPLTLDDLSRAALLFHSLKRIQFGTVYQMLVFVPDSQYALLAPTLQAMTFILPFDVLIRPESILFQSKSEAYPYAIQMAIKLLCARLVQTRYYVTLDADVILNQALTTDTLSALLPVNPSDSFLRAVYENEDRNVHPTWWTGSEAVLRLSPSEVKAGFGVTPVIMSTYGSLLTLNLVIKAWGCSDEVVGAVTAGGDLTDYGRLQCDSALAETVWLNSFGRNGVLWSEYTLYRLALDHYEVFDGLHVEQSESLKLHCNDVWFREQLPWHQRALNESNPCLFSVVQSSTGVSPGTVYSELMKSS